MEIQYLLWLRKIAMMLQLSSLFFSAFFFSLFLGLAVFDENENKNKGIHLTKQSKKVFWALVVCMLVAYLVPPESYFDALIE